MGYIYIHTNKINGKKYIGQTTTKPKYRWNNGKGYMGNTHFYNAIQKCGWDNFEHYCFPCPDELLDDVEKFYINYHDTVNPSKGYNRDSGGKKGKQLSDESRQKMSEARKGNKNSYGCKRSKETRQRISDNHADFRGNNHPNYGKHWSEEVRNRMSKSKEKFHYTIQSPKGEIFETNNLRAFCKEHGLYNSNMARGKYKGWTLLSKERIKEKQG